jgi:hypothetical protein
MKVVELQRSLGHIVAFTKAAGASEKVAAELDRALQCLDPFKEKTLAEFNEFLRRADEYDRTGKLLPPARNGVSKERAAKAVGLTVDEAVKIFKDLHDRATDPAVTFADIDAKMKDFEKLTIPQLQEVAAKVGVTVPAKPKKQILEELTRRIKELKVSFQRTQFRFGEKVLAPEAPNAGVHEPLATAPQ